MRLAPSTLVSLSFGFGRRLLETLVQEVCLKLAEADVFGGALEEVAWWVLVIFHVVPLEHLVVSGSHSRVEFVAAAAIGLHAPVILFLRLKN